jgi:DNA-binding transcriptional MerR regulator
MTTKRKTQAASPALDIANVIAAFSEEQVERMTGLSKGRLRYWARTDFFKPSFVEEDARLAFSRFYSFKDVVALRTLEMLRVQNSVPLQHLRKVAAKLSHLKDDLWTKTELFVIKKEVNFVNPETGNPESVLGGQGYLLPIRLAKVIEDTSADIVNLSKRRAETVGKVARNRSIARNAWVVAGTRIPVAAIKRLHEDGFSASQIVDEYPDLTESDIQTAIRHSEQRAA